MIHLYAAFDLAKTQQRLEPDEIIELVPTALADALDDLNGPIVDAKTAIALLLAARRFAD